MMKKYQGYKFEDGSFQKISDNIVPERALQISINGEPFTITMQSPGDEILLSLGLLYSEGYLDHYIPANVSATKDEEGEITKVNFTLPDIKDFKSNKRSLLSVASCGICGQTELELPEGNLQDSYQIHANEIFKMFDEMHSLQDAFVNTGGSHAAAIFDKNHNLMICKEDVGRHNAVDKAVGGLVKTEKIKEAKLILISGRISYEILVKCFKAKTPILAAVSTPSSLAIDFAKELGITLIGFCRDNKLTVYSKPERLKGID